MPRGHRKHHDWTTWGRQRALQHMMCRDMTDALCAKIMNDAVFSLFSRQSPWIGRSMEPFCGGGAMRIPLQYQQPQPQQPASEPAQL